MNQSCRWLVMMVKVPKAGRVKTRLARDIGAVQATRVYRQVLSSLARRLDQPRRWRLVLAVDRRTGHPVKVVIGVFAGATDQQVFFLINQILPVVFAVFEIRRELYGVCRAGLFAEAAEDAAGKIDPEKNGVAPPVIVFGGLKGDSVHRTGRRTQVTGDTALFAVRVARQDDPPPESRRQRDFFFRILDGDRQPQGVPQDRPDGL